MPIMTRMYLLLAIGFVLADNAAVSGELDFFGQRLVVGGLVVVAVLTYSFPFVMVPMLVLAGLVVAYLHYSRHKDSL
jgi:hypothetical protein